MSNDDGDGGITRRKVLAAAAGAGGLGVAGGVGSAALLRDEESFGGLFEGGSLNLKIDGTSINEETLELDLGTEPGHEVLELSVPDDDGNNPGYVWFRPSCPSPATPLAEKLHVEFSYADSENAGHEARQAIAAGPLPEVANKLSDGYLLTPGGDDACLAPDDSAYLHIKWNLNESYSGGEEPQFVVVFRAKQCRYGDRTESPFNSRSRCNRATLTPTETPTNKYAISNIGFCTDSDDSINPEVTEINNSDESNPTSVDWKTDIEVDFVTLFFGSQGGPQMTIYDYRDEHAKTSGTAIRDDEDARFNLENPESGAPSRLCAIAEEQVNGSYSTVQAAKLNFEDGEFK